MDGQTPLGQTPVNPNPTVKPTVISPQSSVIPSPVTPRPTPSPVQPPPVVAPHKAKPNWGAMGLIILAVVVLATGYYFLFYKDGGLKLVPATYHYAGMETVKVAGGEEGHGASFLKPADFYDYSGQQTHKQNIDLYTYAISNHTTEQIARISLTSGKSDVHSDEFYTKFGTLLTKGSGPDYEDAFIPLKNSTLARVGDSYQFDFQHAKAFTSSGVKEHAWSANFSATKIKTDKNAPSKIQGITVLVISKTATYYFIMYADSVNWQANQPIWQQVLNSLKVDQ